MKKKLSFLILMSLFVFSWANASIVIKNKDVSFDEFKNFLEKNPQTRSLSQYYFKKWTEDMKIRQTIFEVAGLPDTEVSMKFAEINSQRRLFPLSMDEIRFINSLADKNLHLPEAQSLYCFSHSLSSSEPSRIPCSEKIISLETLQKHFPEVQALMIEGAFISRAQPLKISQKEAYNWVLLSDAHSPIQFFGTYENLLQQRFEWLPVVSGSCDRFSINSSDVFLRISAKIYFSADCLREAQKSKEELSFEKESRKAIWITSAIVLGAVVYSLKDKRISIDVLRF